MQPRGDDHVPDWVSSDAFELKPEPKQKVEVEGSHDATPEDGGQKTEWRETQEWELIQESLGWFKAWLMKK